MKRKAMPREMDDFAHALSDIEEFRRAKKWDHVIDIVGENLHNLLGLGPREISKLTDIGITAKLISRSSATIWVPYKKAILITLLKEAGNYATVKFPPDGGRGWYLKCLNLLLDSLRYDDVQDYLTFLPTTDDLLTLLSGFSLPVRTRLLLMRHYEYEGHLARARDEFIAARKRFPKSLTVINAGFAFFERLNGKNNAILEGDNLSRFEIQTITNELVAERVRLREYFNNLQLDKQGHDAKPQNAS